ncbi:insulinase family protein [Clostridium bornimense]|uniref:M16 family metallopeptidase n=1 Tax=Clostridium bornimense TaxID=1216932 RepID=UPI001C115EE5|nr:pitrilysin family protein [Clostridium bornimense]MBU5314694.1 insulinase family protein [Clostridium bornimense]
MIKYLSNGIKVIIEEAEGELTNFTVGFNGGALQDDEYLGICHYIEHGLFLGTKNRSEEDINKEFDKYFGFYNAMTNYSYVVYYGTTFNEDFKKGIELYSDILLNPTFPDEKLNREKNIIYTEIDEWLQNEKLKSESILFSKIFDGRLQNIIHGTKESIKEITKENVIEKYESIYVAENCTISIVTALKSDEVLKVLEENFSSMKRGYKISYPERKVLSGNKIVVNNEKSNTATVFASVDLHGLNKEEKECMYVLDYILGNGTNSILYDRLRTTKALVYDVETEIRFDSGVEVYLVNAMTSKDQGEEVAFEVEDILSNVERYISDITEDELQHYIKKIKMNKIIRWERKIQKAKDLSAEDIMYSEENNFEGKKKELVNKELLLKLCDRIKNYSILINN